MIPRRLHFVWLGPEPPVVAHFRESVVRLYPGWDVRVWRSAPEWPQEWEAAWCLAPDRARQADVLRAWALLTEGGVYYDSDFVGRRPLPDSFLACPFFAGFLPRCADSEARVCWQEQLGSVANGLMGSEAGGEAIRALANAVLFTPPARWQSWGAIPLAKIWAKLRFPLVPPDMIFPGWVGRDPAEAWQHAFHEEPGPLECAVHLWLRGKLYEQAQEWLDRDRRS